MLERLTSAAQARGAQVTWAHRPEGAGRHLGTLAGHDIVLYFESTEIESWFTLAHLFGHLCQRTRPTDLMYRAIDIVRYDRVPAPLTVQERSDMWEHEYEAMRLGAALIAEAGGLTEGMAIEYALLCRADYRYLTEFLETGVGGDESFAKWLATVSRGPHIPIEPLYELVDLAVTPLKVAPDVHVL